MQETSAPYAGLSALVVDDDPVVRVLLSRILLRMGLDVSDAGDGASALGLVSSRRFDIVITDLSMPGMDGMDFMRKARDMGLTAPIVFLTATGSVPLAVEAIKSGAFEFLEKPLNSRRLTEVVSAALDARADRTQTVRKPPSLWLPIDVEEPVTGPASESGGGARAGAPRRIGAPSDYPGSGPPARVGRYEVQEMIGRGGMGIVYRCRDPMLGRTVAVKVLNLASDEPRHAEELVERFKREAAAAGTLHHPAIVAVHDMGQDEARGDWFLVMELVDGHGLNRVMDERGPMPEKDVISLGFQVADALAYAHANGVTHRDIKPSNVLVLDDGSVKLLDFGLAAVKGWTVTLSGRILGSPSYMAPERIRGEAGGSFSDQFSLGVVLYEALTGKNPFDGDTLETRFLRVLQHDPVPVADASPSVSPRLSELISVMMAKEAFNRFSAIHEVADRLVMLGKDHGLNLKRHISPPRP